MDDARRLAYLDAIGITRYVARRPLPGAKPSPEPAAPAHPATQRSEAEPSPAIALTTGPAFNRAPTAAAPTAVLEKRHGTPGVPTGVHHCQIAIWLIGELLLLADAPQLDNTQLNLLRNLLRALGRPDTLPDVHQFHWPLPQRKDKSLDAARDHFQGMLDGGFLQDTTIRHILCLGNAAAVLLDEGSGTSTDLHTYRERPVTMIASLQQMLREPERKRDAWPRLQPLVRL